MFELYKNEIKRLKFWIIIPALVYLFLNSASIYFGEYADSGLMIGNVHSLLFGITSVLMGVVQFHAYKKNSRWVYLINRPSSHVSLCLSLIAAGATIVLFQYVMTDLIITVVMDSTSHFVIEKRHYYQAFYVFFLAMSFYLTGVYIQLCHSKGAFLVIIFPVLAVVSLLLGGPAILISLFAAVWMVLLVLSVFKANINNNKTHLVGKILAVIPYQLGLFLILSFLLSFVIQLKSMLVDGAGIDIPWNLYFADDVYHHVEHLAGNEKMALNLQEAEISLQKQYSPQLKNIQTVSISPEIKSHYSPSLMPYQQKIYQMNIVDSISEQEWVFSMDEMLFISQKQTHSGDKILGITSENGQIMPFESVPTLRTHFGQRQVITNHRIYFYDTNFQTLNLRVSIPDDETLLTGLYQIGSLMGLITTQNIYLFDTNKFRNSSGVLQAETVVEIPGAYENLSQVEIAEMMDSTLVSLLFGNRLSSGHFHAKQVTIEIDHSTNHVSTLATRDLHQGFSEIYYKMDWVISPLIEWTYQNAIKPVLKSSTIKPESLKSPLVFSNTLKMLILIFSMFAIFLTFWYSKNRSKTAIERWSWVGLSCLTGVIGFLTFLLLSDKKTRELCTTNAKSKK